MRRIRPREAVLLGCINALRHIEPPEAGARTMTIDQYVNYARTMQRIRASVNFAIGCLNDDGIADAQAEIDETLQWLRSLK